MKEEVKLLEVCWLLEFNFAVLNRKQEGVTVESLSEQLIALPLINLTVSDPALLDATQPCQTRQARTILFCRLSSE